MGLPPFFPRLLSWKILFGIFGVFLVGILLFVSIYFYVQYQGLKKTVLGQNTALEQETLLAEVGRLMEIPKEIPTIATVSDVSKLKTQDFFKMALNGDKVLIFQNAKKAILFRPSIKKIVEVGPISETPENLSQNKNASSEKSTTPIKIALLNGTSVTGLTKRAENVLIGKKDLLHTIVEKGNAAKDTYARTLIISVSSGMEIASNELEKLFNATIGSLPDEETIPKDADIIILLGEDFAKSDND